MRPFLYLLELEAACATTTPNGSLHSQLLQRRTKTTNPIAAFPDRRHRPMPALSPRTSASPKRHGVELGHHNCASGSRAVDPRARAPCS